MPEELKEEVPSAAASSPADSSSAASPFSDGGDVSSSGSANSDASSSSAGSSPSSAVSDASSDVSSPISPNSPPGKPTAAALEDGAAGPKRRSGGSSRRLPKLPAAPKLRRPRLDCITAAGMGKFLLVLGPALVLTGLLMDYMIHKAFPGQIKSAAVVSWAGLRAWGK
jgi:hypothetical protein